MIPVLHTTAPDFEVRFSRIVERSDASATGEIEATVRKIIADVVTRGDDALVEYSRKLDDRPTLLPAELEVPRTKLDDALATIEPEVRAALERAAERINAFHRAQAASLEDATWDDGKGVVARLVVRPLDRAGVYVPGGTAAYPSTVLMNVIPAKIAGVREVIMVTPAKRGVILPAVLAAAKLAGADRVFSIGGAQAVAALAHGTASVPAVDKIVGPGNAWVAEAKRQVFGKVAIDQVAGPSEVLVVADESASARVVAADLLAQAEHDVRSAAVLVTWSPALAAEVEGELAVQLASLPRAAIAKEAIEARGGIIVARDRAEAIAIANRYAPEHLSLSIADAERWVDAITAAGALFVGHHATEALGDYNAGINHVLPTSGTARFGSPLSVHDFVRRMNVLTMERRGLDAIAEDAARLARVEGLEAHARAVEVRTKGMST